MKRVLIVLFIFAATSANAQIETGNFFIGGTLGISSSGSSNENINGNTTTTTDGISHFGFNIIPEAGYMVTDQIGVGVGLGYEFNKTTTPDFFNNPITGNSFEQIEKANTFIISPFARYYYKATDKFYLYGNFAIPIRITNNSSLMWNNNLDGTVDYNGTSKNSSFGINLKLGANYFVTDNVALEARFNVFGMNYYNIKSTNTDNNGDGDIKTVSGFNFNVSSYNAFNLGNFSVGIRVFF
jgi:hypothetical protein